MSANEECEVLGCYDKVKIEGKVKKIIFENKINSYFVCLVKVENEVKIFAGIMPDIKIGETIIAHGCWSKHYKYGNQFIVSCVEKKLPQNEKDMEKFLSSKTFPGIGKLIAKRIVSEFKEKTFDIIENNFVELTRVKGITKARAKAISEIFCEFTDVRDVVIFLQKYNIPVKYAFEINRRIGRGFLQKIIENPYIIFEAIDFMSFDKIDKIAKKLGVLKNFIPRIKCAVISILKKFAATHGHVYLPHKILIEKAIKILEVEELEIENAIFELNKEGIIFIEEKYGEIAIFIKEYYEVEKNVAEKIKKLLTKKSNFDCVNLLGLIKSVEREIGICFDESQKKAIVNILNNSISIISGGPGTGKTTIINALTKIMNRLKKNIVLAAPTGRAAGRISEVCCVEAKTIHRLLEIVASDDKQNLQINSFGFLRGDILVVDEMSMVDIFLMEKIMNSIPLDMHIVLIGDVNQLPSIGPGSVLKDLIESEIVSHISLTEVFRQAQKSMITVNAHKINIGDVSLIFERDFLFIEKNNEEEVCRVVLEIYLNELLKFSNCDKRLQIQVLTSTRKGIIGTYNLNRVLQSELNPFSFDKNELNTKNTIFRTNDKVMQIVNNYQIKWINCKNGSKGKGVFNGETGFIDSIDLNKKELIVQFDEKIVKYNFSMLDELELAYAITVHKSQGSEFEIVIMPIFNMPIFLIYRNLLYTAVTRAKKNVFLVGKVSIMEKFIKNNRINIRYSTLKQKLNDVNLIDMDCKN
ncbi:MAG: ATP-dependent RecD-like DNA helicase [Clostridiales bacterium]|nr:ATP-dependent RecD-like DNA helicase [Clostridiales bacterium]